MTPPSPSPGPPRPHLEIRGLCKSFLSAGRPLEVLRDVDLTLARAESIAVLGPSGSGKSTLLALVAGLDNPTRGGIWIDGLPVHGRGEDELALLRRHHIGFVFQSFQLLANRTARENVMLPLELLDRSAPRARADLLLDQVGLADRGHHYPSQLSGGEQQRVALARAFANEPALLLADEPTGNLDRANGANILRLIGELRRTSRTTLVVVTHDPAVAEIADRRARLTEGELAFE
ncbi:MAG: ABC transporter ATP-binding protein [Acidobacteriota bacterium]|nr:ABC transporter ATP-binding protein [Acidobacteriota bacterium]